ncbi:MAG: cytochrome c3 family protein [Verrucomicrobia bacterium]|nr:cytochrome c3 family protein [Verrucomicrobiota bacterium]
MKTTLLAGVWASCALAFTAEPKLPAHSQLDCANCHDTATLDRFSQLQKQLGKNAAPGWDRVAEAMPLNEAAMQALGAKCADCHAEKAKDLAASGHALTYAQSFLNREHNRMEPPMDDCLRCHAMFFDGTSRDLVTPLDTRGPWRMPHAELTGHRSILCVSCHQIHPECWLSPPSKSVEPVKLVGGTATSKAGFFDRREHRFFPADCLPHPKVFKGGKLLKLSDDVRIRICYQCHAPSAAHQTGTSDDRTLRGIHESMSCLDCHATHSLDTRAACAQCHPAASHCGLDVTRMDTTARAKSSKHDIHNMTCTDCHAKVPKAR